MVIVHELVRSLIMLTNIFFEILRWLLVIRILLSWFGISPHTNFNELIGALYQVTDVILAPFRRLPLRVGMIDFSAIVAFVALDFIRRLLVIGLSHIGGMGGLYG